MPTDATASTLRPAAPGAASEPASMSRISPAAIVIGALIAAALMLLLDFLGLGIGLFAVEPGETARPVANFGIGAIL